MLATYACYEQVRASDSQGEVSTIAVRLHDKTRIGEDYQVTPVAPVFRPLILFYDGIVF